MSVTIRPDLMCGKDQSIIVVSKCVGCSYKEKKVLPGQYISCPHIHPVDNLSTNCILTLPHTAYEQTTQQERPMPTTVGDSGGVTITTATKQIPDVKPEEPKSHNHTTSVWDIQPYIKSPEFSLAKKVILEEIK